MIQIVDLQRKSVDGNFILILLFNSKSVHHPLNILKDVTQHDMILLIWEFPSEMSG